MFYDVAHKVRDSFARKASNGPQEIEVLDWMSRTALELIGQCGLGYSFDPLTEDAVDNYYTRGVKKFNDVHGRLNIAQQYILPYVHNIGTPRFRKWVVDVLPWKPLRDMMDIVKVLQTAADEVVGTKKAAMNEKGGGLEKQVGQGKDIISILLKANMKASAEDKLTDEEVVGQIAGFIFAAMDTSSNAVSRTLFLLSQNPAAQDKLRDEIREAHRQSGGDRLGYDESIGSHISMLFAERLFALPTLMRETCEDVILPFSKPVRGKDGTEMYEVLVPKGTSVFPSILSSNTDPSVWGPDAYEWRPERWIEGLPESVENARIPGVYSHLMSFIAGGRACIGLKFAQLELKVILSTLVANLKFSPAKDKAYLTVENEFQTMLGRGGGLKLFRSASTMMMQQPDVIVSRLLSTNTPPTAHEADLVREQVASLQRKCDETERQEKEMGWKSDETHWRAVAGLQTKIQELKAQVQQYKAILSPCRHMPIEILTEVIIDVVEETDIARLLKQLWNEMSVSVSSNGFSSEALSSWLYRARKIPRKLSLFCIPACTRCRLGEAELCRFSNPDIARLLKDGPPLEAFTIKPTAIECFANLATLLQLEYEVSGSRSSWDSLKSLTIIGNHWTRWKNVPSSSFQMVPSSTTDLTLRLPDLPDIEFNGQGIMEINMPSEVLQRLTSLDLTCNWTIDCIFKLLQQCKSLQHLKAEFDFEDGYSDHSFMHALFEAAVVLPQLQTMALEPIRASLLRELPYIGALSLLKMTLTVAGGTDWCIGWQSSRNIVDNTVGGGNGPLAPFFHGSRSPASTLKALTIRNGLFVGDDLFKVLSHLTSLTTLALSSASFDENLFTRLSEAKSLPALKALYLLSLHLPRVTELIDLDKFVKEREIKLTTSWWAGQQEGHHKHHTTGISCNSTLLIWATVSEYFSGLTSSLLDSSLSDVQCMTRWAALGKTLVARCVLLWGHAPIQPATSESFTNPSSMSTMQPPSATLSTLISTNTPPSAQKAAFVREEAKAVEAELQGVERRVQEMLLQIDQLRSSIPALDGRLKQYRLILSPFRQIPVEAIGETFTYLADGLNAHDLQQTVAKLCRPRAFIQVLEHMAQSIAEQAEEFGLYTVGNVPPEINIPPAILKRLTSLDLVCDWKLDYTFRMLQHCSNLEALTLNLNCVSDSDPDITTPRYRTAVLPKLRIFTLRGLQKSSLTLFKFVYGAFQTPAIVELSLSFGQDGEWCPVENGVGVGSLFDYDSPMILPWCLLGGELGPSLTVTPTLQKLTISNAVFQGDTLVEGVKEIESLTHLTLISVCFDPNSLRRLSLNPRYLPKLEMIKLVGLHRHFDFHSLELKALSRWTEERGLALTSSYCQSCVLVGVPEPWSPPLGGSFSDDIDFGTSTSRSQCEAF
ncbi:hypothetical protein NMY22_g11675 [Coprinellus aureogranulatus]|nr:hypothetical protein NMY22_g11675 [Coprinellus aureogranulatus]